MAIPQADAELNQRLLKLIETIGQGNAGLQQALRHQARNIIGAQKDIVEEYEDHLERSRDWTGKEAQEAKARLLRLKAVEIQRSTFIQQQTEKLKNLSKQRHLLDDAISIAATRSAQALHQHGSNSVQYAAATLQHTKLVEQLTKARKEELKTVQETRAGRILMRGAADERRQIEAQQLKATTKWGQAFRNGLSTTMNDGLQKLFGSVSLGSVMSNVIQKTETAITTGAKTGGYGVAINPLDQKSTTNFAKLGYNTEEAIKAMAEHRRTIMSTSRGLDEWVEGLDRTKQAFGDALTTPLERSMLAASKFETATAAGIRIRAEDATSYGREMDRTAKLTGMTYQEFSNSVNEMIKDDSIQQKLKAATTEQERRAIVDGIAQQFAQNKAMGMTTQQAMGAAKALGKLAGEGPLERFRKAAKIRAMGAAMGMGGEANRAADILQLGNRATKAQQEEMQGILGKLSEVVTQTGTGSLSAEIFADTLSTKLDLKGIIGAQSEFNTTLAKAVAPLERAATSFALIPEEIRRLTSDIKEAKAGVVNNDILMAAVGAAGALLLPSMLKMVPTILGMGKAGVALGATAAGTAGVAGAGAAGTAAAGTGAAGILGGVTASGLATAAGIVVGSTALIETAWKAAKGEDDISNYVSRFTTDNIGNMFQGIEDLGVSMKHMMGLKTDQELEEAKLQAALAKRQAWLASQTTIITNKTEKAEKEGKTGDNRKDDQTQSSDIAKKEADRQKLAVTRTKQIDTTNETLKKLADNSDKQLDLAEKQLILLTMTEQEKELAKTKLRRDNRFGSQHGFI